MLPKGNERKVLKAIQGLGPTDAEAIARKVVLSPAYVEEVCLSLIEKGFIRQIARGLYALMPKGEVFDLRKSYIVTPRRASIYRDW